MPSFFDRPLRLGLKRADNHCHKKVIYADAKRSIGDWGYSRDDTCRVV